MNKFEIMKRNKNFRDYSLGDIISQFGTGMSFIGVGWYLIDITGKSSSVGFFMSLNLFAGLIAYIFAGTAADRYSRRNILIFSNMLRGVLTVAVVTALFMGITNPMFLYSLAIFNGFGWGLYMPASRGLVHELLEKGDIVEGNSILEITLQIGTFLSGGASGFVFQFVGIKGILIIDALTYFISVIFLLDINYKQVVAEDSDSSFFTQFSNGFRYLKNNKMLFTLGVLSMVPSVITVVTNVILPGYIKQFLNSSTVSYGISDMCYGIGAFISGLIAGELLKKFSMNKLVSCLFALSTLVLVLLFANKFVAGLFILYFTLGLSNTMLRITLSSVLMERTIKEQFGRAMSVWLAISSILQIALSALIGKVMDIVPANSGYGVLAIGMFIGFVAYIITLKYLYLKMEKESIAS
jgi:MFS family permease